MQSKLKYIISLVFASLFMLAIKAQTFSPQSQFGLGNLHSPIFSNNKAMGGIAAGFRDSRTINTLNPASYSAISYTTFNVGLHVFANVVSDSARVTDAANGGLDHLALAFPVMQNRWGMSIGLLPYSYKKYSFNSNFTEDGVNYDLQNNGTGSTYKFYWGNGFKVKDFSFGVNGGFLFGQLDETQEIIFADSLQNVNTTTHNKINLKDFTVDFGVQYQIKLNKLENQDKDKLNTYLTLGAYGAPSLNLKTLSSKYSNSSFTSVLTGEQVAIDSVSGGVYDVKQQTKLPAYFGVGATFTDGASWTAGADYHFENWKSFNSPINSLQMANEWHIKVGGEIIPDYTSRKFFKLTSYRIGANFGKSRVMVDNEAVSEIGMTFGFGIPLGKSNIGGGSLSKLNLSLEAGRRGAANNDLAYKENYYKITLAYSLSDRWFIKRKFD